ncbi:MAG: hypothetical protein JNK35_08195 [Phycisphaerae bacterium]|nr:hypothetical protein [Phycisphaerae bacterium]
MITRVRGHLEAIDGLAVTLRLPFPGDPAPGWAIEVLVPGYVARELAPLTGQPLTLHTFCYLEGQGQGASFEPRLIGFLSPTERRFFDLFTTVKGIGNRKALRALTEPPPAVAAAIAARDTKWLTNLPEIGKRLAETIVAELHGKADAFADPTVIRDPLGSPLAAASIEPASRRHPPAVAEAIEALCALGETRADAERKVLLAVERAPRAPGQASTSIDRADTLIALVYSTPSPR